MEVVSLWNLRRGCHVVLVVLVDLVNILAEVLLLERGVASIAELMVTGLEIARLGTGRTSVTGVGIEVI